MREQLIHMLTEAAEMEHNLLCSYLYAAFSLRRAQDGLTSVEAGAVDGWRKAVMGVAVQEMGHLAIVNNLLVAVGGDPHFQRPNFPVPAGYHPSNFVLRLTPFDKATLEHFIFLERPEAAPVDDAAEFNDQNHARHPGARRWITPTARDYETIGGLYRAIRAGIRTLVAARSSHAFVADERQVSGAEVGLDGVVAIHDPPSAYAALARIVEQGEGAHEDSAGSHYARFCRIREEWTELERTNPKFRPAHSAALDPVMRKPADTESRTWISDPASVERLDLGNAVYGALLLLLARLYEPASPAERTRLAAAAVKLMHGLAAQGEALARMGAGISFTVPRNIGARGAPGLLAERVAELAEEWSARHPGEPNALRDAAGMLKPVP